MAAQLVVAQPVVSLLLPYGNFDHIYGSVVQANAEKVTYSLDCKPQTCDIGSVTQGPSTWEYAQTFTVSGTSGILVRQGVLNSERDVATLKLSGSIAKETSSETVISGYLKDLNRVTITAGVEKLESTASTTASAPETTNEASSTHSTGAAAPAITQNAALLGVAAMIGGAALLL